MTWQEEIIHNIKMEKAEHRIYIKTAIDLYYKARTIERDVNKETADKIRNTADMILIYLDVKVKPDYEWEWETADILLKRYMQLKDEEGKR